MESTEIQGVKIEGSPEGPVVGNLPPNGNLQETSLALNYPLLEGDKIKRISGNEGEISSQVGNSSPEKVQEILSQAEGTVAVQAFRPFVEVNLFPSLLSPFFPFLQTTNPPFFHSPINQLYPF